MSDNSTPFTTLDKQITAWNTFLKSENKQEDHEEATIFALSTSEMYSRYIHKSAELEQLRYYYVAQRIADLYWQHNLEHRGKDSPRYPGHFGCRVRLREMKLEMFWVYNQFKPKKNSDGFQVISHYLPREGNYRYPKTTFTRAQDWEKPVIDVVEEAFAIIRRANANLMRMRQLCKWNDTNLFQMAGDIQDFKEESCSK